MKFLNKIKARIISNYIIKQIQKISKTDSKVTFLYKIWRINLYGNF